MANKTIKKKKAFQAFCRRMVAGGSINNAEGGWMPYDMGKAMHRDMYYGYRIGQTDKKKGKVPTDAVD